VRDSGGEGKKTQRCHDAPSSFLGGREGGGGVASPNTMSGRPRMWQSARRTKSFAAPEAEDPPYKAVADVWLDSEGGLSTRLRDTVPNTLTIQELGRLAQTSRLGKQVSKEILPKALASDLKETYPNVSTSVDDAGGAVDLDAKIKALRALETFLKTKLSPEWKAWAKGEGSCPIPFRMVDNPDMTHFPLVGLTELQILNLSGCTNLRTPPNLAGCTALRELFLNSCPNLSAPPDLAGCSQTIRVLYMGGCTRLTVPPNVAQCTQFQTLVLQRCTSLTEPPTVTGHATLIFLDLGNCTALTAAPDLTECVALNLLDMENCTNVTTPPTLTRCPRLKIVKLRGCVNLSARPSGLPEGVTLQLPRHLLGATP